MFESQPGARIHGTDPFAVPQPERSPARQLRGRLAAPVTLWTAIGLDGRRAGLTVSSTLVADGQPARLLGLIDPESELFEAARTAGRFVVAPLDAGQRHLSDLFAGILPAPGGPFRDQDWADGPYGPVLAGQGTWAGCRWESAREIGWGTLVEAVVEHISIGDDTDPLVYFRGRYRTLG